ncbi:PDR/VanB family oxidoreductase [Demequina aestuarii]|uniref:PDR/VanB family oxidoreductase n=1 Tax=Demequina aestuarii TaxID=327095 RepID=UPI000786456A|nr:PDR/VanB family oxidoreductase [Demequina aestuarii]
MTPPTSAIDVTVASRAVTGDVVVLDLAGADGAPLPTWTAGSHIDVLMPEGVVRQYSLCGDPDDDRWRIAVLREADGRGGSRWLADHALVGTALQVVGPRNHFAFETDGGPVLLLAAGIGVTPLWSMAAEAARDGIDYRLRYSGSSRASMALVRELTAAHGDRCSLHVSDEGTRLDLDAAFAEATTGTVAYACGPRRYLEAVEAAAGAHDVPLRVEHFTPVEVDEPVLHDTFEVELAMTGITVEVPPDQSILAAVEEHGVLVLSSCTEGTCGTCETPVLAGEVDHRDSILTPAERERNDVMYVCVSRAACPRLTLDL